jgi:hypothetical protein
MVSYKAAWEAKFRAASNGGEYEGLLTSGMSPLDDYKEEHAELPRRGMLMFQDALDVLYAQSSSRLGRDLLVRTVQIADVVLSPGWLEREFPSSLTVFRGEAWQTRTYARALLGHGFDSGSLLTASSDLEAHANGVKANTEMAQAYKEDYVVASARLAMLAGDDAAATSVLGRTRFAFDAEEVTFLARLAAIKPAAYRIAAQPASRGWGRDFDAWFDKIRRPDYEGHGYGAWPPIYTRRFEIAAIRRQRSSSLATPADWLAVIEDVSA